MATTKLAERLKELTAFLTHQHAVDSVEETMEHLQKEVADDMVSSRASAQQCTIFLFQSAEPPSLLRFLAASADFADDTRKREISSTRCSVLELLASFLKLYGSHQALTKQHVVDIFKACQQTARTDPFNRVKAHAVAVVVNVLKYADKRVARDDIEPKLYVDTLFYDVKFSKASQTAKGQMLELIGYLVEKFPLDVEESVPPLLSWIEDALEKQFSSNSPEMMMVNGLLFALARLLECDPERYKRDEVLRKKIYSYLLTVFATTVSGNLSRYQVTKSSEIFIAKHAQMFLQEIGSNGHVWFSYVKHCCMSENKTIKEHAFVCSNAIFEALNAYMVEVKEDTRKKCLNKILKEVLPVVNDSAAGTSAMAFAIQCLGWFTQSIYVYLGAKGYGKIEEKLKAFGETILALDAKAIASRWTLCSQYIQCIGQFVQERHDIQLDQGYVKFLGDLLCHVMTAYPQCLWKSKVMVYKSVSRLLSALSRWTVIDPLVDRFLLHTLMLSISNATGPDQAVVYHPETGDLVTNLLYDYEGFWVALFRHRTDTIAEPSLVGAVTTTGDIGKTDPTNSKRTLQGVLFGSTVKNVRGILSQLNLSYRFDLQTTNNGKNATGYTPIVPRDHSIMLNLTEFVERVLGKLPKSLLLPWISLLMKQIFASASKLPLVSSFYRIGTVLSTAMDDLKYFGSLSHSNGWDMDRQSRFCDEFKVFVQRICVQARFYQDELLFTCAEFVLSSPVGLVPIEAMTGILKSNLELGRSYLPAAVVAVKALERWQRECPMELEAAIPDVVSVLSNYLDQDGLSDAKPSQMKSLAESTINSNSNGGSDLKELQHRILILLAKCGGKITFLLSESPSVVNAGGSMGNFSSSFYLLDLQLSELPVSLAMDPLLSHLGKLAAHSSVRRVKASASESYHALVCYLCGKTTTHPHAAGKKTVFYDMWQGVFAQVVRLATDPEKICRSLFEPLLFQLLRWLAKNRDTFPFEYASILDELTRSLSDPETSVRTMASRCFAALLSLALEDSEAHIKVEDIFERVFSLCRHPGAVQRSGAAASISYFLRSVNEENGEVLTKFALPCVKNLLYALRLCDSDAQSKVDAIDISRDVISKAVMKIERGICRFPQLFLKKGPTARNSKTIDNDTILQQTTIWLFQQTAAREVLFRRLCRHLFISFSSLTSKSSLEWIEHYTASEENESISSLLAPLSSLAHGTPEVTLEWMEQLSASIESYVWCVELLGDKAEDIFKRDAPLLQEAMKRKHTSAVVELHGKQSCQQILEWAVASFFKCENPWNNVSPPHSRWIGVYLSVLVSICRCIKSYTCNGSVMLRAVADVDDQALRKSVVERLLQTVLHRPDCWANDSKLFDEIEDFCAGVVVYSQTWAQQYQQTVDTLLLPLTTSIAKVNSDASFAKDTKTIHSLSLFGSKVLCSEIVCANGSAKHASTFALVAGKTIQYGQCSPDNHLVAVAALKAAAACGWRITDVFVNTSERQLYGPVYNDVVHFIPTLAVWKQCANPLMLLSLESEYAINVLVDALHEVINLKVYTVGSAEWDAFTKTLVANIKQFVKSLDDVKTDTQRTLLVLRVLRYFLELCQHCSENLLGAFRIGPIRDIQDAVIRLLKERECSYLVKADLLKMLALLVPASVLVIYDREASDSALDALTAFVFQEFPIVSTDVSRGSKDFDIFHLLFSELLDVIEQSKSITYLAIIYSSMKEAHKHIFREEIKQMLVRFSILLATNVAPGEAGDKNVRLQLVGLLDVLLDPSLDIAIRKTLLEEVFTPLIECQTGETLQRFYLMESPKKNSNVIGILAALVSSSAEVTSGGGRIGVFVAYSLVEILYRLLDPEVIRLEINSAFLGHKNGKGREFTMLVCKCASKVVTKTYTEVDDLTRLACCAAYGCLLTAVSRTQKQEKFFDQILFQPALWSNILDPLREYELRAETEKFGTIPLSSLSSVSLQARQNSNHSTILKSKRNGSGVIQFFTASSLSLEADSLGTSMMTLSQGIDQTGTAYQNVEIELDDFNQHPCMMPLLRVLMQMKSDFGSSWSDKAMPGWMKKMFDVIVDSSTSLSIRLFLSKLVLNVPEVFSIYASSWLRAVMDTLVEATESQMVPEFHYLLRDCCNLVLDQWSNVPVSSFEETANRFISELVQLSPDRYNRVRNSNVMLVTSLIGLWKDSVRMDASLLVSFINSSDEDNKLRSSKQFVALQTVSAMMDAGQTSDLACDYEEQTVENGILSVMQSKTTSLYTLAAEVGGRYLQSTSLSLGEEFACKLTNLILGSYNDEDFGRFLALLRNASLHQPQIIDSSMLQRVSFVLPKAVSVDAWALLAAETLNNAAANENIAKEIFLHTQSVLGRFIVHRNTAVQLVTLRAISHLLDYLTSSELEKLVENAPLGLGLVTAFEGHELLDCRELLFAVARKLSEKNLSNRAKSRVDASLLRGLCDPDDTFRKQAFEYWNNSKIVASSCSGRFLEIFGPLYSQELDEKWVLYATSLLVGMYKENDESKRSLFPSALGSGEYTEANIDASWEANTQSMTPLFSIEADTFSVREDQPYQPSMSTSQVDGSQASGIQSQLFSSAPASQTRIGSQFTQQIGKIGALQQQHIRRERFSKRRVADSSVQNSSNYEKKASKRYFQDQYALLRKREDAQITRERRQRQGQVFMKRTYRMGDYPDIEISRQDIVDPIMELCEVHVETSSLVFSALFSSIVTSPQFQQPGNTHELAESLERTLKLSKTSSIFVGCILSAYFSSIVRSPTLCEALAVLPDTIGEAGLASGKYHLSELALEEQLIHKIKTKVHSVGSDDWVISSWDLLHKLLSTVHKRNFLIALSIACSTTDESQAALQAQLSGDLPLAIASYKKVETMFDSYMGVIDGSVFETDATRCRWQRFNCLETLNNWGALNDEITDALKKDDDFLWTQRPPYLQQGIRNYMRSCLGQFEATQNDKPNTVASLHSFIENAMRDTAKQQLIQTRFPVETCLTYLAIGETNQARVCVESFYCSFLKMWRQTSTLSSSSRMELMQSLSSMVQIGELLMLTRDDCSYSGRTSKQELDVTKFMNAWRRAPPPSGGDDMMFWSQYMMVQNIIAGYLLNHGEGEGSIPDKDRLAILVNKSDVMLQYADAAISCNILALASKMLKSYRELCNTHHLPKLSVQMVEVFVSHVLKLVDRQEHLSSNSGSNASSVKLITRYYDTATKMFDNVEIMNMMETAPATDKVAMGYLEAKTFASAAGFYAYNDVDDSLKEEYFARALDMFKVSCGRINTLAGASYTKLTENTSAAFLRCRLTFIEFLNDLLFKRKMEKLLKLADRKTLTKLLAENVLGGMTFGDRECAHYFPQICDLIAPFPDIVTEFERQVLTNVPLWTCLQWSSQLMALLNGPIGKTIVAILEKMAQKYPVALFYDFMVTCRSSLDTFKVDLHRLEVLLTNTVMEKFVTALRLIHHPELRLKEGLREVAKLLDDNRTPDAHQKVKLLWKDCFSPDRPLLGGLIGRYNRDWSQKAKRDIEKIMGKDGTKLTVKSVNTAREWIMSHFSVTPGRYGITKDMKARIGDFAEWLEEFDHSSCSLELPGQYTAHWGPPDPSAHIRILSFDSMLGVLASKQLPKRLTLHCTDEKDYTFLVKGGEDLRLDQRIEQLFGVMNQILDADPRCREQKRSITTYDVIPMTQEIGILEWLDGTSTLKGVIEAQLQIDERCTDLKSNKRQKLELFNTTASKAYETFLLKQRGASFSAKVVAPRSKDVVNRFAKVQEMIPADLLRRQLLGMGANFEAFLLVRDHFLKSLAVFSACSYVLGIGDRHLDNFLFDLSSGRVIGIDFGVSFGAGASVLPVPELIPFRYTRQMDFVFQPYDGANLLAQEMQAVFEALRSKRQVIESVMKVFLDEPLLDWQQSTSTHQKALFEVQEGDDRSTLQDSDVEMEDMEEPARSSKRATASPAVGDVATAWLPDVKIAIARRKLEGVSPGLLLKEELSQNSHLKQHMTKFHALIDAASSDADETDQLAAMSSLAQAQELLKLATAPDLLGRTFQGWMPWL